MCIPLKLIAYISWNYELKKAFRRWSQTTKILAPYGFEHNIYFLLPFWFMYEIFLEVIIPAKMDPK